jgi:hypothetical protein
VEASINGVIWTLRIELVAVPLILLVFFGFVRWGMALPIGVYLVLAALSFDNG